MRRSFLFFLIAAFVVMVVTASSAFGAGLADSKAKEAKAGGAKAEAECKDGVIEAKAGGVVAKAPCVPVPPK